ncbi:hypothetical protein FMM74_016345 [Lachnospiraceae bacterium MD308]|nr:hypothetical protein [Lachnospiraceae bacterium MD308]
MLYITDNIIKLGGVMLPGQVQSVNVQESANIHTAQDDTGAVNSVQPRGYEISKITVEVLLEETSSQSVDQMIRAYQALFKKPKQKAAVKRAVVNEDCAAHGITSVYFKSFETKNIISESKVTAALELWSPNTVAVKVTKKSTKKKKTGKKKKNSKKRTKKKKSKSAAKDKRNTSKAKKRAKNITKK